MKVALVFNPFSYKEHEENLRIVQKYFGLFPPLSLAWVAAIVRQAGHDAVIIDARTLRLSKKDVLEKLIEYGPDVIGSMMTTYMFPETLEWIRFLKRGLAEAGLRPKVLVGGYNLRVYPEESLSHPEIDFGCFEHAFFTVPALLERLRSGSADFEGVPGLVWRKEGKVVVNPHPQKIDFDKFPNPARDLLPNDLYAEFPTQRKNFTVMITSLGCPFRCAFCEAGGCEYNPRSPRTVVNEMKECAEKYGISEIDIFDYEFTGIRSRVREICRLIKEEGLEITWACRSRIDTVDEGLLREMHSAGCRRIYWGIEHGCQEVLDAMNKGVTLAQAEATIAASRRAGIQNLGFFLVGVPGETRETVSKTLEFAKKLDLEYVQFSKLLAKPGTGMWKEMVGGGWRDYWSDWVAGREKDRVLPRPWLGKMRNEEVDRLAKWAYISYYARPGFLLRHAFNCRSAGEFLRKFFAFAGMLLSQEGRSKARKGFTAYPENIFRVFARKSAWIRRNG